ncbi:TPA: hypothetical protein ACH9PV_005251, partial [Escherichia coli]
LQAKIMQIHLYINEFTSFDSSVSSVVFHASHGIFMYTGILCLMNNACHDNKSQHALRPA